MLEQRKCSRSFFRSCRLARREFRSKRFWLKCLRVGKSHVTNQIGQPRPLQRVSRSPVKSLSIENLKATSIAKLLSLLLLDRRARPKALHWPSEKSIVRFFRFPTLSGRKT